MKNNMKQLVIAATLIASFVYIAPRVEAQSIGTSVCVMGIPDSVIKDLAEGKTTLIELKAEYGTCLDANMYIIADGLVRYVKDSKTKMSRQLTQCAKVGRILKAKAKK